MMNNSLIGVLLRMYLVKREWSTHAEERIKLMSELAVSVEEEKRKRSCTTAVKTPFGNHFVECGWVNPTLTIKPNPCVCSGIEKKVQLFKELLTSIGEEEIGESLYFCLLQELEEF